MDAYEASIESQRSAGKTDAVSRSNFWFNCTNSVERYTLETSNESEQPGQATLRVRRQLRDIMIMARMEQCVADVKRYRAWQRSRVGACPTVTGPNYVASYCDWVWGLLGEQEKEEAIKYGEEEARKAALQPMQLYKKVHSGSEVSDVELQLYYLGLPLITMFKEGRKEDFRKYCLESRDRRYTIRYIAGVIAEQARTSTTAQVNSETSSPGNLERRSTF